MGKFFSIVFISVIVYIIYDLITESNNKIKTAFFSISATAVSFILGYLLLFNKAVQTIGKFIFAIYGALLIVIFVVGHIVGLFSIEAMNKISEFWAGFKALLFFVLPIMFAMFIIDAWVI